MQLTKIFLSQILLAASCAAVDWHFVSYNLPSGQEFISQSGVLKTPPKPSAQTNYIWPGLQPTDNSGVYQNVLDDRGSEWAIGSGWCCSNPSLPWGGSIYPAVGSDITFSNVLSGDEWVSTLTDGSQSVTNNFPLTDKTFNDAVYAIELYGTWDFGPVTFSNIEMVATGTDTSFCYAPNNYNDATVISIQGASATVANNQVTCTVESITLESAS